MPRESELERALAAFPFSKLKPPSFRVKIASLTEELLSKLPVRIWVETGNIPEVVQVAGTAHIIRTYPHLDLVYLETFGDALSALVKNDLVRSVWNDLPVKAEGCVVTETHPSVRALAPGSHGRAC
jgi:hypothetical protein